MRQLLIYRSSCRLRSQLRGHVWIAKIRDANQRVVPSYRDRWSQIGWMVGGSEGQTYGGHRGSCIYIEKLLFDSMMPLIDY